MGGLRLPQCHLQKTQLALPVRLSNIEPQENSQNRQTSIQQINICRQGCRYAQPPCLKQLLGHGLANTPPVIV